MSIGLSQRWQGQPLSLVALRSSAARLRYVRSLYLVAVVTVAPASDDGAHLCLGDDEVKAATEVEDGLAPADVDVPFCGESFAECFEDFVHFFVSEVSVTHGATPSMVRVSVVSRSAPAMVQVEPLSVVGRGSD